MKYLVKATVVLAVREEIEANSPDHAGQILTSRQFSEVPWRDRIIDIHVDKVQEAK